MGIQNNYRLSVEQSLALFLYSRKRDQEYPLIDRPSVAMIINTAHPHSPRMYDIAEDFSRYVGKDPLLAECYDMARHALCGE